MLSGGGPPTTGPSFDTRELMNETASRALPGMSRLSVAVIALSFALLIAAFVLTVFTF
jgi:hypothetical protein